MDINKKIKDKIDNIFIGEEINIDGDLYILSEIDNDIYVFDKYNSSKEFKVLDYGELFDILYSEVI